MTRASASGGVIFIVPLVFSSDRGHIATFNGHTSHLGFLALFKTVDGVLRLA